MSIVSPGYAGIAAAVQYARRKHPTLPPASALLFGFDWQETLQGYHFWQQVYRNLWDSTRGRR